ncbi:adenosylhomocysteinase [Allokutzneria oryzae]|uniref:Adenosylhomocysteinase n=1 Tax=Allokutzneria oryzae TaxID=1378989 RepID=A0ABV5ZP03_9PSEU
MLSRIPWVVGSCGLLASIGAEFDRTRPFAHMVIGTAIHLEPKTVALLLTLRRGGAEIVAAGNLNSTQPETVDHLRAQGVHVVGSTTTDHGTHVAELERVLDAEPHLLLDNGGELFERYLTRPYERLLGGTEETTSGRMRLEPLRAELARPVLVVNDSPIKQFAENTRAVGLSVLESFLRITNRTPHGARVTVLGYGACGRGVAECFRQAHALVSVIEVDPVARLRAHLDGFDVLDRTSALSSAEVVVTVTGARDVLAPADLPLLRDDAVLANAGHFPDEINLGDAEVAPLTEGIDTVHLANGKRLYLLGGGHMVNLAGPRALGNSVESMDLGFALQSRCLEAVATGAVGPDSCVVPVPTAIDERVATEYVALRSARV